MPQRIEMVLWKNDEVRVTPDSMARAVEDYRKKIDSGQALVYSGGDRLGDAIGRVVAIRVETDGRVMGTVEMFEHTKLEAVEKNNFGAFSRGSHRFGK